MFILTKVTLTSPGCTDSRSTRSHTRSNSRRRLTSRRRCGVSRITTVNARAAPRATERPLPHTDTEAPSRDYMPRHRATERTQRRALCLPYRSIYSSSFMLRAQLRPIQELLLLLVFFNLTYFNTNREDSRLKQFFYDAFCLVRWSFVFLLFLNLTFTLTISFSLKCY